MAGLNREKLIVLAEEAGKAIIQLRQYAVAPSDQILASVEKLGSLKYHFVLAIEASIDICQHITSRLFSDVPESYADCFKALAEHKVIDKELSDQMGDLARFRNVLVHLYWKVDNGIVVDKLSQIERIERYLKEVFAFCEKQW